MARTTETVIDAIRTQIKEEIGTDTLKNPEKFQIEQKYGLIDTVLTEQEIYMLHKEEYLG